MAMFAELYTPLPDAAQYLDRIGFSHPLGQGRDSLDGLMLAHLQSVPFENLDIYDFGQRISLHTGDLYDKVVARRRGGYCFELNALFMRLLEHLGFRCDAAAARVLWNKDYLPPCGHRVTVVHLEGRRLLCDVGFGGPTPGETIDMEDPNIQHAQGNHFLFEKTARGLLLHRVEEEQKQPLLLIDDRPAEEVDFVPLNAYFSTDPASYFLSKRMVNIKTPGGSAAIDGDVLRLRGPGGCTERQIASEHELLSALKDHFGIELPADQDRQGTVRAVSGNRNCK